MTVMHEAQDTCLKPATWDISNSSVIPENLKSRLRRMGGSCEPRCIFSGNHRIYTLIHQALLAPANMEVVTHSASELPTQTNIQNLGSMQADNMLLQPT